MTTESQTVAGIFIAALGGAAVGVERERSGRARGPGAHFAGVRTFTLMGGLAGTVGWLWTGNLQLPAVVLLLGAAALVVAAYAAASRNNVDGTTEVAALIGIRLPGSFASALQMAALFQAVLFAVHVARGIWGQAGVLVSEWCWVSRTSTL